MDAAPTMAYWFVAGKKFVGLRTLGICENTFSCAKIVIPRQEFCANDQATLHCSINVKCFSSHILMIFLGQNEQNSLSLPRLELVPMGCSKLRSLAKWGGCRGWWFETCSCQDLAHLKWGLNMISPSETEILWVCDQFFLVGVIFFNVQLL
jgi:hypothetical protein